MEDADAFSSLYEREGEAVLVFLARRTLDVETAVELTAETFAIALGSWGRVRDLGVEQARAWLFTVARRQFGRYLRKARVERRAISRSAYGRLISRGAHQPLINRATDGLYATGSTFTPITATAALESGVWSPSDTYDDTGQYCFGRSGLCLRNAGNVANGSLDLVNAIRVSDDVFFYNLGALLNVDLATNPRGGPLQQWARRFGIGSPTGIDLPYESSGTLRPGPRTIGDNINLAVGQGDLLMTPLQLAVAYAAIANGGTIVRPHIASEVVGEAGDKVIQTVDPGPVRRLDIRPAYLDAIRHGLRQAASAPGGTSSPVMANFPERVYGAAGSAPRANQRDQAWYVCYVPATATSKPIVVVVTVEKGGFGAVAAAPVARQILSQWFFGTPGPYLPGTSAAP